MSATSKQPSARHLDATAVESITRSIVVLRDRKVVLDAELAALYGVTTKRLNEQIRRNQDRFRRISCFSSPKRSTGL